MLISRENPRILSVQSLEAHHRDPCHKHQSLTAWKSWFRASAAPEVECILLPWHVGTIYTDMISYPFLCCTYKTWGDWSIFFIALTLSPGQSFASSIYRITLTLSPDRVVHSERTLSCTCPFHALLWTFVYFLTYSHTVLSRHSGNFPRPSLVLMSLCLGLFIFTHVCILMY